jgi:PqqD family protein of HPr-rel-A system
MHVRDGGLTWRKHDRVPDVSRLPDMPVWSVVTPEALHWKMWDDECVVFNATTGQTHILDPVLALLIRQIDEGCNNTDELLNRTTKLLGVDLTEEIRETLGQMLHQLAEFSLIESVSP